MTKVRSKQEVIQEVQKEGRTVHFATLMVLRHLKSSELDQKFQKYIGLRGDIVKDDSGSHAVCAEQGSSASQTTAAKAMDVVARRPGCARRAADAASACAPVRVSRHLATSTTTRVAQIMLQH